ncbi:cytochrome c [Acidipila sp. EB88]|uniref:c-type cytochrome n=1 Tax=Acidipila sp. EB88 TaxID=2305226 RepID=UPI00131594FC|nr:cytochrome c [Acidipila sp. EB88]
MKRLKAAALSLHCLLLTGCTTKPYQPSAWLTTVPAAQRTLADPLPRTPQNLSEGQQQYALYCSSCHADDGGGRRSKPSLRNSRVRAETDGELHWILLNGSKNHGMPAWRSLGDASLWQLVQYIRSMPPHP